MRILRVVNQTNGAILAERAAVADTFWARARGLLGKRSLPIDEGLVIEPCGSVHTLGMSFPIDVVHLDRDDRVLRVVGSLRPWRLGPLVWRSHSVLELPAGTADATGMEVGDHLLQEEPSAFRMTLGR